MDPFSTPTLVLADLYRLIVGIPGLLLAAYQVALMRDSRTTGQRARLATIAVALAVLSSDRLAHLGTPLTWELAGATLAVLLAGYGTWRWSDEVPAQPRRRHR